jgi:N6-L-threonylcarbamoyladenine synthase
MRLQAGMQEASTSYTFEVKPRWPLDAISRSV